MTVTAYDVQREGHNAAALVEQISMLAGEDAELIADMIEGQTDLLEVIEAALARTLALEELIEGCASAIDKARERKDRFAKQREHLRTAIAAAMDGAGMKRHETALATLSLRATPPKCEIVDESLIPTAYLRTEVTVAKADLLKALKAGEQVPGAVLAEGSVALNVRRT